jgi:hypothetical protein
MLIKGSALNAHQRNLVLAAFVHRWTHENAAQTYGGKCPACAQSSNPGTITLPDDSPTGSITLSWHDYHHKLTTDQEWLDAHAFHFTKDGKRLMANRRHAEPAFMAD